MMKIFNTTQIRNADAYTISHEPISSINLMERAGERCFSKIIELYADTANFTVLCGTGNNGGDGLVIARLMADTGKRIVVIISGDPLKGSSDFIINYERLKSESHVELYLLADEESDFEIRDNTVYIDALFGSGLNRALDGINAKIAGKLNESYSEVISVDIPSGLNADSGLPAKNAVAVKAALTLSLQFPKLFMMLPDYGDYCGNIEIIPIGLHPDIIRDTEVEYVLTEMADIAPLFPKRKKFSHKGNFGHALLMAGSYGSMGAAILSAKACMRTGTGLLTAALPGMGVVPMQTAVPEAMIMADKNEKMLTELPPLSSFSAVGFGMGCGQSKETASLLKLLIQDSNKALMIDADGLNILSENKTWLGFIPKGSILTPHPKEFDRLTGKASSSYERLQKAKDFSKRYAVYLVLKGAYTAVCCPDGKVWFNPTGNPGMATAGSGDVLSGIITSLLARGLHPKQAAIAGVFLHGLAGDVAAQIIHHDSLIASDIVDNIGAALKIITEFH